MSHPSSEELLDLSLGLSESAEIRSHMKSCSDCACSYAALAEEEETLHMYYTGLSHPQPSVRKRVSWKEIVPMSIAAALLVGILTWIAVPHRTRETPPTPAAAEKAEELYRRFEKRFVESKSVSVRIEGTVERSNGTVETYSGSWKAKPGGKLAYSFQSGHDKSAGSVSGVTFILPEGRRDYPVAVVTRAGFLARAYGHFSESFEYQGYGSDFCVLSGFRFGDGPDADRSVLEYCARFTDGLTLPIRLVLDRKTLTPLERSTSVPDGNARMILREKYGNLSTEELPDGLFTSGPRPITTPEMEQDKGEFVLPEAIRALIFSDLRASGFPSDKLEGLRGATDVIGVFVAFSMTRTRGGITYESPAIHPRGISKWGSSFSFATTVKDVTSTPINQGYQFEFIFEIAVTAENHPEHLYQVSGEATATGWFEGSQVRRVYRAKFTGPKRVK